MLRALLLLLAALCWGCQDSGKTGIPVSSWLTASATMHQFGDIPHGHKAFHTFTLRNDGGQRVRLKGIRHTCSCATQELSILRDGRPVERAIHVPPVERDGGFLVTTLDPKETLSIKVVVDTTLRPGLDHKEPGRVELAFEPQEAGLVTFSYEFVIRARLRMLTHEQAPLSPTVKLGDFSKDQEVVGVLELAPLVDGPPVHIVGIKGTDELLRLDKKKPLLEGGYRWLVRFGPAGKPGQVQRLLRFQTDYSDGYVMNVVVDGIALPNLGFVPAARLDLHRFDWSRPKHSFVTLIYRKPVPDPGFEIGRIKVEKPDEVDVSRYFEAEVTASGASRWQLTLRYLGGLEGKRFDGFVQLKSNDPEHESTLVRFTGFNKG